MSYPNNVMSGIPAVLFEVWGWWARQMQALLPRWLSSVIGQRDALLVETDAVDVNFLLRRRRQETPIGRYRLDATAFRAVRSTIRPHKQQVILRPDPSAILHRTAVLPLAAEGDLRHLLRYEMDRLTPFTADQVFWSATVERRDRGAGRLEVSLALVPKSLIEPALAALQTIGLNVRSIEGVAHDGCPQTIPLSQALSDRRRSLAFTYAAVGVLALAAIGTPFVTQSVTRAAIEVRIAGLQPRVAQVDALRHQLAAGLAGNDVIAAEQAHVTDPLQVLATMTDLLPDDTVLADLSLRQGKLSISGRSRSAPELIHAMAADALLRDPSFAAPVTRTQDGKADTFVIHAELGP